MKKLLTMAMFLAAVFALSACGGPGQESGQSGEQEAAPPEPTQAESEAPSDGGESQTEEAAPSEGDSAEDASSGEGVSEEAPSSGPTATTVDGEEVSLGGDGEATALFFMAGW